MASTPTILDDIKRYIEEGEMSFLIGAGFSLNVNNKAYPLWGGLLKDATWDMFGSGVRSKREKKGLHRNEAMFAEYMSAIDNVFEAIAIYVQCRNDKMSGPSIIDALDYLNRVCDECKEHGGARVLIGRKQYYESILDKFTQDTTQIRNYLAEAKGMPADTDEKILEEEIGNMFKV